MKLKHSLKQFAAINKVLILIHIFGTSFLKKDVQSLKISHTLVSNKIFFYECIILIYFLSVPNVYSILSLSEDSIIKRE